VVGGRTQGRSRDYSLVIRHDFNLKFSQFLKSSYETTLRSLFKVTPQIDASGSSLFVKFTIL